METTCPRCQGTVTRYDRSGRKTDPSCTKCGFRPGRDFTGTFVRQLCVDDDIWPGACADKGEMQFCGHCQAAHAAHSRGELVVYADEVAA